MKRVAQFNVTTYLYFICWGSISHTHPLYVCVYICIYDVICWIKSYFFINLYTHQEYPSVGLIFILNSFLRLLVKHNIKLHESHLHVNEIEKQNRIILIIFCRLSAYLITFFLFYLVSQQFDNNMWISLGLYYYVFTELLECVGLCLLSY